MALFSSSKYPNTAKYEAEQKKNKADYERFNQYAKSDELKRINELEILINSADFTKKVDKLKNEKFKDTAEFRQLQKYTTQKKSAEFKKYFKYVASGMPERVKQIEVSSKRKELAELNEYVRSSEFQSARQQKGFKKSEAYQKFKRCKALTKDKEIRLFNKQVNSSLYKNYLNIHNSERLKTYQELEQEVTSEKFIAFKNWMEDKKKFQKSEEYSLIQEYNKLVKSPDYIWYKKVEKDNSFSEIKKWQLLFEDDFSSTSLNREKWITGYYWGKALLNKTYVLENEKQFFTDNNISISGKGVQLSTRNEHADGLVWDSKRGFMPKAFDFTAGLISTGQSHRQQFGKIEAKVKVDHVHPVRHAFWLVGEKMAPQIDVFRFEDKNAKSHLAGLQLINGKGPELQSKTVKGAKFDSDYFVYSIEWTKDKLSWFINGVKVNEQTNNIPDAQMYLVFSSHITDDVEKLDASANMYIEWVRCYQQKN
ncbi:family 16 glycosylhydrolase [Carboxylicivirga sediminis]|uniref:Family 16 glycosylhydrolase n=1 Tax=Carboxylicivirga sediminis TaxID=2006564 RepID=A0A941IXH6_9BACT|nr:glycoside hydrolase family 16 protein [Carboxylicivirga sediminis]MBR8536055.1 family 16 glycosylhydrolase [Carboxylicivirga sediminis]